MNKSYLAKLSLVVLGLSLLGVGAATATHDAGANGNTVVFSNFTGTPTTFTATAITKDANFQCFNSLPEVRMTLEIGGLGSGTRSVSGVQASRFQITWTQASTSNVVTFSPRFVSRFTPNATSTGSVEVTTNYTTFSLQVTTADTVTLAYAAPVGGAADMSATPDAGGSTDVNYRPMSFSNLVIASSIFTAQRSGPCFPQLVNQNQNQNQNSVTAPQSAPSKYEGPEILALDDPRPMVAGGKLVFTGKNLSAVTSATIGSMTATLSYDAATGLTIATPPVLAPGKYDLVMQSSYGKLTHINAVTIKAPTPTATIGFRSDAPHLNEKQVLDLVAFNQTLNPDYEKVRCIVNASDPKTAKRIADLVCAQVARGEARNVEVIKDLRNTYSGEGFWVRVYAAG